jgi:DNA invertase Pin-like site-specific DNA recombinase
METLDFTKLKPSNYNRKSSEGEDKQALSNDSQIAEAERIATFYKLPPFVKVYKEAKSARKELNRPQFSEMLELIRAGEIDSIVCWKADRLARNMTEGGQIIDLISSGVLKAIITHNKVYYPHDNVLMLAVEFGQGHQFVKELSTNVKRGQKTKASRGMPHGVATLGFINDKTEEKGNRKWLVDEVRLHKIKILLDMFLTGTYSAGKLYLYAVEELNLTTVQRKHSGGAHIVLSRIYEILVDPIYAGFFYYGGERYELDTNLPHLITEDQHEKIKHILAKKNIPKVKEHKTTFSGFIISDEGNFVGQDVKYQLICDCKKKFAYMSKTHCPACGAEIAQLEHPKYLEYILYYNVKKKKMRQEYKTVSESKVAEELDQKVVKELSFSPQLVAWSKKYIEELRIKELNEILFKQRITEDSNVEFEKKKARLRTLLRDEQITDDEYRADLTTLHKQYDQSGKEKVVDWYSRMNELADLTGYMENVLKDGTVQQKRNVLSKLGSNLIWNDKLLTVYNTPEVDALIKGMKRTKLENPWFEPKNCAVSVGLNEKTDEFSPVFSTMLRG